MNLEELVAQVSGEADIDALTYATDIDVGGAVASWLVRLSRFEPWPGTLCCVLGQGTLLSQCLSPPRCINGFWQT